MPISKKPLPDDALEFVRNATVRTLPTVAVGARAAELLANQEDPPAPAVTPAAVVVEPTPEKQSSKPTSVQKAQKKDVLPWDSINPEIVKNVQIRMPLVLKEKIKFILENTIGQRSAHELMLCAIESAVESELQAIKREGRAAK